MGQRLWEASGALRGRTRNLVHSPYGAILAVYLILRIATIAGITVARYPDSKSWLTLDFAGDEIRLWTVSLFFKVLPADGLRGWGQAAVSILCWTALAGMTAWQIKHARLKVLAFAAVLTLALTTQITNWDTVILGESLAISLTVGAVAAWWLFVLHPEWQTAALVCVVHVLWAFLRHPDVVMTIPIALIVAASLLRPAQRAQRAAILAVLLLTLAWGLPTITKNKFNEEEVLITIVSERILTSSDRTAWFADHGMPDDRSVRKLAGSFYTKGLGSGPIRENERLYRWIQRNGRATYFEFLLTHPGYLLLKPVDQALSPEGSVLSGAVYGRARPVLPDVVQSTLFGGVGQLVSLGLATILLAAFAFRIRGWTSRELVPAVALVLALALYLMLYHGVASEPERHYMQAAAAIRALLLVVGFLAADRLLIRSAPRE